MKYKLLFMLMLSIFSVTACSSSLVNDIYKHTADNNKDSITAFIILSNMRLSEQDIDKIINDYKNEKNEGIKYYYEYLLAKRTQEKKYISAFINSSKNHLNILIENNSNFISISSPIYKQLAYYSKTDDDALNILFKIMKISDGANLAIVSEDLFEIKNLNPNRFIKATQRAGVQESEINNLMENE